ncbi:unnamed protein product, partial [Rotaria sp. Silwood1]
PSYPNWKHRLPTTSELAEQEQALLSITIKEGLNSVPTTQKEKNNSTILLSPSLLFYIVVIDSAALKMISQLSQVIPGKSHLQFPITFEPTQIGLYQLSLLYIINNFYQHYVKVIIDVCLPTVQLSTDKLLIRSLPHILAEDSFRKVVHLYNPLNAPAKFRAIEPYQTIDAEVIWYGSTQAIIDSSLCAGVVVNPTNDLVSTGLQTREHEQEIYMTGEVIEPNLNIPESEINYGGVSILMKVSK